jgi:hypothetical protein
MKQLLYSGCICISLLLTSCQKEKAIQIGGVWNCDHTQIQLYGNNEVVLDSTVTQSGFLSLSVSDGLDNIARTNLPFVPLLDGSSWEIPHKKTDQIFFSYYSENPLFIYTNSVMITKHTKQKLVLVKIFYDDALNITEKDTWEFSKQKL